MEQNIYDRIISLMPEMTKSQKQVADYITRHPIDSTFLTLEQISSKVGTSTTTVIRFANFLGLDGYSSLQREFQLHFKSNVTPSTRLESHLQSYKTVDASNNKYIASMDIQINNIVHSFDMIPEEAFDKAVNYIGNARHIYLLAVRGGMTVALYMHECLNRIFCNTTLIHADIVTDWCNILPTLSADDVIIAASFPRYSNRLMGFFDSLKDMGCKSKIILFTDSYASPFGEKVSITFPCICEGAGFQNSPVAAMAVVDSILGAVANANSSMIKQRLKAAEKIMQSQNYYLL